MPATSVTSQAPRQRVSGPLSKKDQVPGKMTEQGPETQWCGVRLAMWRVVRVVNRDAHATCANTDLKVDCTPACTLVHYYTCHSTPRMR